MVNKLWSVQELAVVLVVLPGRRSRSVLARICDAILFKEEGSTYVFFCSLDDATVVCLQHLFSITVGAESGVCSSL